MWTARTRRISPWGKGNICTSSDFISYSNGLAQWSVRQQCLEIRVIVQALSTLVRLAHRPFIIREEEEEVLEEVSNLMDTLENALPLREHSILIHVLQHVIRQQYSWGCFHMMIFERVNQLMKNHVSSRRYVEAGIVAV